MHYAIIVGLAGLASAVPQSWGNVGSSTTTPIADSTSDRPWTTPQIPSVSITDSVTGSYTDSITDSYTDTATDSSLYTTATDSGYDTTATDSGWGAETTSAYGWNATTPSITTKTPCGGGETPSTTEGWDTYATSVTSVPDVETSTSDWNTYETDSTSIPDIETSTPTWSTDSSPSVITVTAPCTCCTDATTSAVDTWSGYTTTPVTESLWSTYSNFTMTTHAPIPTTIPAIGTFTGAAMPTAMPQAFGAGIALVAAALIL